MPELNTQNIPLADLAESAYNPRKVFAAASLQELADSIRSVGLLQPLLVRLVNGSGRYEVIAGARRRRAAELAGLTEVPAVIRDMTDSEALEASITENLQRADVHPMEDARGYRALMEQSGWYTPAIAARLGKREDYIYRRLLLTALVERAQELFEGGRMHLGHALAICRLQPADQERILTGKFQAENYIPSVAELNSFIEYNILMRLTNAPFDRTSAYSAVPAAGACTDCPKASGNARMLFPDLDGEDTCTDPTCFQAKIAAMLDLKRTALSKKGFIEISSNYTPTVAGPLGSQNYEPSKKGECPHTKAGLVVDSHLGALGQVKWVCTDKDCNVHGRRMTQHGSSDRAAQKANEMDFAIRSSVKNAILGRVTGLERPDLEAMAFIFFRRMEAEAAKRTFQTYGWYKKGGGTRPDDEELPGYLAKMSDGSLAVFLMEIALEPSTKLWSASSDAMKFTGSGPLLDTARRYGVDIERHVEFQKEIARVKEKNKGANRKEVLSSMANRPPDAMGFMAIYPPEKRRLIQAAGTAKREAIEFYGVIVEPPGASVHDGQTQIITKSGATEIVPTAWVKPIPALVAIPAPTAKPKRLSVAEKKAKTSKAVQ